MDMNKKTKFYLEAQYTVEMVFLFPFLFFLLLFLLYFNFYLHDRVCLLAIADQLADHIKIEREILPKDLWMMEMKEFSIEEKGLENIITVSAFLPFVYPKGQFDANFKVKGNKISQAQKTRMITLGLDIVEGIK